MYALTPEARGPRTRDSMPSLNFKSNPETTAAVMVIEYLDMSTSRSMLMNHITKNPKSKFGLRSFAETLADGRHRRSLAAPGLNRHWPLLTRPCRDQTTPDKESNIRHRTGARYSCPVTSDAPASEIFHRCRVLPIATSTCLHGRTALAVEDGVAAAVASGTTPSRALPWSMQLILIVIAGAVNVMALYDGLGAP